MVVAALSIVEARKEVMDFTDVVYYDEYSVILYKKPDTDDNFITVFIRVTNTILILVTVLVFRVLQFFLLLNTYVLVPLIIRRSV